MGNLLTYGGISTKVRAMQKNLIHPDEYRELVLLGSVPEAVNYLRTKPAYRDLLESIDEAHLHRGDVEAVLVRSLYRDFSKLYRFAGLKQRRFLNTYFHQYEIVLLKYFLRGIFNHNNEPWSPSKIGEFFRDHSKLDIQKLANVDTIEEFLGALQGTDYYAPLSKLANMEHPTLFDYEMTLDLFYFSTLWKSYHKQFSGKELNILKQAYGSMIDLLNIQWIYRSKTYYQISSADIYALLIPIRYKLKQAQIVRLVEAADEQEFNHVLAATYYSKKYDELSGRELEKLYTQLLYHIHQLARRKNPYSIACINSYLYQKGQELDNLTTILESIRYGLQPADILKYITAGI